MVLKRTIFLEALRSSNEAEIKALIMAAQEQNTDLNYYEDVTEFTHTPLLDAVTEGCKVAVLALLDTKAVKVDGNGWGYSPLMIASGKGFTSIVDVLLAHKADINYEVEWCQTSHRQIQIIRTNNTFIELDWYNTLKRNKYCAVDTIESLVIEHDHFELLQEFMKLRSEKLNVEDNALLCAAAENGQLHIAKHLISLGFSPCQTNAKNQTPLLLAARYGCFEMVQYLLTQNLEATDIHHALKDVIDRQDISDHMEIIELLIAADKLVTVPVQEKSTAHIKDKDSAPTKTLMDYAAKRLEIPYPIRGGFGDFGAMLSVTSATIGQKAAVVSMLLEASVPRTDKPLTFFAGDTTQVADMKDAHEALVKKGLHAKDIAQQVLDKFEAELAQSNATEEEMDLSERLGALLKEAKPDDVKEEPFSALVGSLFAFFGAKKEAAAARQAMASQPKPLVKTMFLRCLDEDGPLHAKPEKELITKTAETPSASMS